MSWALRTEAYPCKPARNAKPSRWPKNEFCPTSISLKPRGSRMRATPGQQVQMVSAFRAMLVRTYSDAIDAYRGQTMRVRPVKTKAILRSSEAVVQSEYARPGEAPAGVEYAMRKSGGEWKIYDITVEGVSLVQTYRPVFDHVTRTEGVDGLVRRLKENGKPRPSLAT